MMQSGLWHERLYAGEMVCGTWDYVYMMFPAQAGFLLPMARWCYWATDYGYWYQTDGKEGEEPTGPLREMQLIWDKIRTTVDYDAKVALYQQVLDLHAEHCFVIGAVGELPRIVLANSKLRNIPERSLVSTTIGRYLGLSIPEQWYYEGG
jgi:peptide/nickel transport system substrate-binding protein